MTAIPDAEALYATLLDELRAALSLLSTDAVHLIGIRSGGAWLAERLHTDLGLPGQPGALNISFYRDDFDRIGLHRQMQPSDIPFDVDGSHIILVDDVLYTGRTIRGALNELFDYGRPATVQLAVLVDRGGRQLPVAATYCAAELELPDALTLNLASNDGQLAFTLEPAAHA